MTLRPWRNASAAALRIATLLCLVAPAFRANTAAAQWVPARPALVTLEAPAPSAASGGDSSAPLGFADAPSAGDSQPPGDLSPNLHGRSGKRRRNA